MQAKRHTREMLRGKAQTVLGVVDPATLGPTLMHEHVLCDIRPPATRGDNDLGPEITLENTWQINYGRGLKRAGRKYMLDLEDIAQREVEMMKHDGGDAMVELTRGGLSPDPRGLERISAIMQHVHSNYEIDLFATLIKAAARETGPDPTAAPAAPWSGRRSAHPRPPAGSRSPAGLRCRGSSRPLGPGMPSIW